MLLDVVAKRKRKMAKEGKRGFCLILLEQICNIVLKARDPPPVPPVEPELVCIKG